MADRLVLPQEQRHAIEALIREHLPGVDVWAYGSRVNGQCHEGSDLDLVLRAPNLKQIPADQLVKFSDAVCDSSIPFLVEARDWARLPETFRREIQRQYVELCAPSTRSDSRRQQACLGDVIRLRRGHDLPKRLRVAGSFPIVSSSGITDCHAKPKVEGPGVIIGRYGTLGKVHFIRGDYWPLNTTLYVEDFKGNDPRYVSYLLETIDVSPFSDKAAVPGLNRNHLHQAEVPFASDPEEQRAIAQILGTLDDKIELNRRMNETLEAMARALFKSWFVDFEPVRAKMHGRDTGLPQSIAVLFPGEIAGVGRGDHNVPVGWSALPLNEVADFLNGLALQKYPVLDPEHSLPVIKISELRNGVTAKTTRASNAVPTQYVINDGDFLFSWSGSLIAKFWTGGTGALNQHLFKVTSEDYPVWFFTHWVQHHLPTFRAIAAGKATTMGHIQRHHLAETFTACPPIDVLLKLDPIFSPLLRRSINVKLENRKLASIRNEILPKLVSGEIRIKQVERTLAEVL